MTLPTVRLPAPQSCGIDDGKMMKRSSNHGRLLSDIVKTMATLGLLFVGLLFIGTLTTRAQQAPTGEAEKAAATQAAEPATEKKAEKKQKTPIEELPFEELMKLEVEEVFTASRWVQKVSEAPASVSIVTSDEIRRYGYRTLAEVLQNVRGFYATYDRLYHYVGARGFLRPGDYNSRILVLLDGHRLNENVYGGASLGTDFPIDVDLIDRVEVIRGPSSSLYGAGAVFAVVNVISKRGRNFKGLEFSTELASFATNKTRITYGAEFKNGLDVMLSTSFYQSRGQRRLHYPEFDTPATNNGFVEGGDDDRFRQFSAALTYGDFDLRYSLSRRRKEIPTAGFGTVFNDDRTRGSDNFSLWHFTYDHTFANRLNLVARVDHNQYGYNGDYVYDYAESGEPFLVINRDEGRGEWWQSELQATMPLLKHQKLTAGAEYRYNRRQDQRNFDPQPFFEYLNDRQRSHNFGIYAQDEITLSKRLLVSLGVRHDRYPFFGGTTNPRLALIVTPARATTLKFLYGSAFRAPNVYEMFYNTVSSLPNVDLRPETTRTGEVVLEQYLGNNFRIGASAFTYRAKDIIDQVEEAGGEASFVNNGRVKSSGVEVEVEGKLKGGWQGRALYSFQTVTDQWTGERYVNSPRHVARLNLTAPLYGNRLFAGLTTQVMSRRRTVKGNEIGGYGLANLQLTTRNLTKNFDLVFGVYNLFNARYGDPAGIALRQESIQQDGRSLRVKLNFRLRDRD